MDLSFTNVQKIDSPEELSNFVLGLRVATVALGVGLSIFAIFFSFAELYLFVTEFGAVNFSLIGFVWVGLMVFSWVALFVMSAGWMQGRRVSCWWAIFGTLAGTASAISIALTRTLAPTLILAAPAVLLAGALVIYHLRSTVKASRVRTKT